MCLGRVCFGYKYDIYGIFSGQFPLWTRTLIAYVDMRVVVLATVAAFIVLVSYVLRSHCTNELLCKFVAALVRYMIAE